MASYVLVLGPRDSPKQDVCKLITGKDNDADEKILRTTVATKYYSTSVNVLVDEYPEDGDVTVGAKVVGLQEWYAEFTSDELQELRDAIEGIILCFDDTPDHIDQCLAHVSDLRQQIDGFIVVTGSHGDNRDEIEDAVISHGFEYVNLSESGYNEYKEKTGKDRLVEILETHEWSEIESTTTKTNSNYEQNKLNKVDSMTTGLLEAEESDDDGHPPPKMDLDQVFRKLQLAKDSVANLDANQKEKYVNGVIAEVLDYI